MSDSPGRATPGSAPSDGTDRGTGDRPARPDATGPELPAPRGAATADTAAPEADESAQPAPAEHTPQGALWSTRQPPPGAWSPFGDDGREDEPATARTRAHSGAGPAAPGPGPAHPVGPAWGAAPGPGWRAPWMMPPAPQPGIVPLRPLGAGEILGGAFAALRTHWRTMLGVSLVLAVLTEGVITVVTGVWLNSASGTGPAYPPPEESPGEALGELVHSFAGTAFSSAVSLVGATLATALLTVVVGRAVLGRSTGTAQAWRDARGQIPRLVGLLVLLPLFVAVVGAAGTVPGLLVVSATGSSGTGEPLAIVGGLVTAAVGVWLWVRYSLAGPALMLEKQGVLQAMRRSAKLTRGAWWRVLGVQLLAYLVVAAVQLVVQIAAMLAAYLLDADHFLSWLDGRTGAAWSTLTCLGLAGVVSSALTFPVTAGATALLYMDQRVRREALDLELGRAAGLPGYASTGPA